MPLNILNHPLIGHKLSIIRDKNTKYQEFYQNVDDISTLMIYEVTKDLKTKPVKVTTPIGDCQTLSLAEFIVIVPILRAGLGMVDGIRRVLPEAKVGFVGLARNEQTFKPEEYYCNIPQATDDCVALLVDPMLATGGSALATIEILQKKGYRRIKYVGLVGAPEGVKRLLDSKPEVDIYLAALDEGLNDKGYIVPGLGDCGDRLYGTDL